MVQTQQRRHRDDLSLLDLTANLYLDNEWSDEAWETKGAHHVVKNAVAGPKRSAYTSGDDHSSPAPSAGSSAVSFLENRFMLVAWTSARRCLNVVPSTSSSTSRY